MRRAGLFDFINTRGNRYFLCTGVVGVGYQFLDVYVIVVDIAV